MATTHTSSGDKTILYTNDSSNPTGYSQTLEERTGEGAPPTRSYVIGSDVIAQADVAGGAPALQYLLYDAHGSTRGLLGADGSQLAGAEPGTYLQFDYDAFGNGVADTDLNTAALQTQLLYSGERYDSGLGEQYLRARHYDQAIGRFCSFDSFEGSSSTPSLLHKYNYANANPVAFADPNGHFALGLPSVLIGSFLSSWARVGHEQGKLQAAQTGLDVAGATFTVLAAKWWYDAALSQKRSSLGPYGALPDAFVMQFSMSASFGILNKGPRMGIAVQETYDLVYMNSKPSKVFVYHSLGGGFATQGSNLSFMYGPAWNISDPGDYTGMSLSVTAGFFGNPLIRTVPGLGALTLRGIFNGFSAEFWYGPKPTDRGLNTIGIMVGPGIGTSGLSLGAAFSDYELSIRD